MRLTPHRHPAAAVHRQACSAASTPRRWMPSWRTWPRTTRACWGERRCSRSSSAATRSGRAASASSSGRCRTRWSRPSALAEEMKETARRDAQPRQIDRARGRAAERQVRGGGAGRGGAHPHRAPAAQAAAPAAGRGLAGDAGALRADARRRTLGGAGVDAEARLRRRLLRVRVQPRALAGRDRGLARGRAARWRVTAPPVDGGANAAVRRCSPARWAWTSAVGVVRGERGRDKSSASRADAAEVRARLGQRGA